MFSHGRSHIIYLKTLTHNWWDCFLSSDSVFTPPARRAWRSYKFASLDFSFFGVRSWAAVHGGYRWHQVVWAYLNTAFNGGICQQNMYFNMYTTKSKPQEGSTCKDCHAKCFISTNSTSKLWPGAMNRGELWECVSNACFCHLPLCFHLKFYTSIKPILYWIIFPKHTF